MIPVDILTLSYLEFIERVSTAFRLKRLGDDCMLRAKYARVVLHLGYEIEVLTPPPGAVFATDAFLLNCACKRDLSRLINELHMHISAKEWVDNLAKEMHLAIAGVPWQADWRTDTAKLLAQQCWDGHTDLLPILADALQDAGCDAEKTLSSMRNGTYVTCYNSGVWQTLREPC